MHRPLLTLLLAVASLTLHADPIPVHAPQGTLHGFLVLRSREGKILANGDLVQTLRNGVVTVRLTFHFRDGSLDDETAVFSQATNFKLISDHHIQNIGRCNTTPMLTTAEPSQNARELRRSANKNTAALGDKPPCVGSASFFTFVISGDCTAPSLTGVPRSVSHRYAGRRSSGPLNWVQPSAQKRPARPLAASRCSTCESFPE